MEVATSSADFGRSLDHVQHLADSPAAEEGRPPQKTPFDASGVTILYDGPSGGLQELPWQRRVYFQPPWNCRALRSKLIDAAEQGNLSAVRATFASLKKALAKALRSAQEAGGEGHVIVDTKFLGIVIGVAIKHDHEHVVTFLLSEGVKVDAEAVYRAILSKNTAILQQLVDRGWQINMPLVGFGYDKPAALGFAVEDAELTAWFLERDADPNLTSYAAVSPLSWAVGRGSFAVVEMLFARGGDVKKGDLLHHAIGRRLDDRTAMVEYLLRKGAPVNAVIYENDPVAQAWFGFMNLGTPLHTAARDGNEDIVRLLVKHGAKLSIRDHKEELAADKAERAGHTGAAQYLRGLQAVQGLSKL